jgi:hypothetical protein
VNQRELLRHVSETLDRLAVPYMLVGSFAGYAYGEPRLTQDIDLVLELPTKSVSPFCAAFPPPDFYLSEPAVRDAIRSRFQFNILHLTSGNKVDCVFPRNDDWGRTQLSRRRRQLILDDLESYLAAPEDVILGKLWYYSEGGSDKHLRDIAGILRVSGDQVDRADVTAWATKLGYLDLWERVQKSVDDPNHPKV